MPILYTQLRLIQNFSFLVSCIASFLLWGAAAAVTAEPGENEEPDYWYQIEFILFEHLNSDRHVLRFEDLKYIVPNAEQYLFLVPKGKAVSPFQLETIDDQDAVLKEAARRLKASSEVKVYLSTGWQQAIDRDQDSIPIKIASGKQFGDRFQLEGTLDIRRARYMHVDIDVFLSSFQTLPYSDIKDWFTEDETSRWPLGWLLVPLTYSHPLLLQKGEAFVPENTIQLKQTRRVKDGEIHYIDHPALGLIATIKRIDTPFKYGAGIN